MKSCIE